MTNYDVLLASMQVEAMKADERQRQLAKEIEDVKAAALECEAKMAAVIVTKKKAEER